MGPHSFICDNASFMSEIAHKISFMRDVTHLSFFFLCILDVCVCERESVFEYV